MNQLTCICFFLLYMTVETTDIITTTIPTDGSTVYTADDTTKTAVEISTYVSFDPGNTRNTAGVISTNQPSETSTHGYTRNQPTGTSTRGYNRNQPTGTSTLDDTRNTADEIATDQPSETSTRGYTRNQPTGTSTLDDTRNTADQIASGQPTGTSTRGYTRDQPIVTSTLDETRNTADQIASGQPTGTSTRGYTRNQPTGTSTLDDTGNTAGVPLIDGPAVNTVSNGATPGDALIDFCDEYGTCPAEHIVDSWYCRCDDLCQVYNDCCKDYQATAFLPQQDIYRCLRTNLEEKNFIGMFVIGVCPEHFPNTTIINSCLKNDIMSGPPVFDRNDDSRIFANQFCATCNNVQNTTPLPIQLYNLPRRVYLEEILGLGSVDSILNKYQKVKYRLLQRGQTKYRSCFSRVEISGNPECQKYVNPLLVNYGGRVSYYRNNFCVEESIRVNLTSSNVACFSQFPFVFIDEIITLSVIFNFGLKKSQDDDSNMCKVWTEEIDDTCSHLITYVNVEEYVELIFETSSNQTDDSLIRIGLVVMWTHIEPEVTELLDMADVSKAEEGQIVKVSMHLIIRKRCFADEMKTIHTKIRERSLRISINVGDKKIEFTKVNDSYENKTFTQLRSFRMFFPIEMYFRKYDMKKATNQRQKLCPNVTISLQLNENSLEISSFACGQDEIPTDRSSVTADAIATYASFSVSIVAMVPLIIVNRRIDDVMTIPRTNLENIAISLILANSLFMTGIGMTSMPTVCYVIGIGLHYLFLTVFVFMTIGVLTAAIAINRLREKRNIPQSQVNRTRLLLTLLGLSLSLIVVGAAFAVDRVGPPRWSPGYSDTACFPTRFPGNIAFFTGPMMLMVTVDTICIIKIIVQIERTKMETRKLLKISTMFDDLKMYLRLVVLGGVLWLIGIVAAVVGWDWLDFAFVLTCGLQGFFISVASLTTQEFKRTIKAMFERT